MNVILDIFLSTSLNLFRYNFAFVQLIIAKRHKKINWNICVYQTVSFRRYSVGDKRYIANVSSEISSSMMRFMDEGDEKWENQMVKRFPWWRAKCNSTERSCSQRFTGTRICSKQDAHPSAVTEILFRGPRLPPLFLLSLFFSLRLLIKSAGWGKLQAAHASSL